jgi:hypothetical protein
MPQQQQQQQQQQQSSSQNRGGSMSESAFFYALGVGVFAVCNAALFLPGWTNKFDQDYSAKDSLTGSYMVDMTLCFFKDVTSSTAGQVLFNIFTSFVMLMSTHIVYVGSRRRHDAKFPQGVVAAFDWVLKMSSAGLATSLMYGFFLRNKRQSESTEEDTKKLRLVGRRTIYAMNAAIVTTLGLGYRLHMAKENDQNADKLMLASLFVPAAMVTAGVLLDRNCESQCTSPYLQYFPYFAAFAKGTVLHLTLIALLVRQGPQGVFNDIKDNPPAMYVFFDLLGTVVAAYAWLHADGRCEMGKRWGLALACGLGAHVACLVWERDREVDKEIERNDKEKEDRKGSGNKDQQQQQQQQQQHDSKEKEKDKDKEQSNKQQQNQMFSQEKDKAQSHKEKGKESHGIRPGGDPTAAFTTTS